MIISGELRYVFIEVPKTASASTRDWLARRHQGVMCDWFHSVDIPAWALGYYTFCVVRNPVDRAISLWSWAVKQQAQHYPDIRAAVGTDPNDFMRGWLGSGAWRDYPHPKLRTMFTPQSEFLAGLRLDRVFQFRMIPHCFEELPFVETVDGFGHKNLGIPKTDGLMALTATSIAAIRAWDSGGPNGQ